MSDAKGRDIKIDQFTLSFHGRLLIEGAEISLNYGQRYGLLGENGSGKVSKPSVNFLCMQKISPPGNLLWSIRSLRSTLLDERLQLQASILLLNYCGISNAMSYGDGFISTDPLLLQLKLIHVLRIITPICFVYADTGFFTSPHSCNHLLIGISRSQNTSTSTSSAEKRIHQTSMP